MLYKSVLEQLIAFFQKNPVAQGKPTTDDEVLNIEKSLNIKLDDDFKEFTDTLAVQIYNLNVILDLDVVAFSWSCAGVYAVSDVCSHHPGFR